MFDIGFFELMVVGVVALLVLGPERLPMAARTCGLWIGRVRRSLTSIKTEIREELRLEELKRTTAMQKEQLDKELDEMRQPFQQAFSDKTSETEAAVTTPSSTDEKDAGPNKSSANKET